MKHNTLLSFRPRLFSKSTSAFYVLVLSYIFLIITDVSVSYGKVAFQFFSFFRFIIIFGITMIIIISNTHSNIIEVNKDELNFNFIKRPSFHIKFVLMDVFIILFILFMVLLLLDPLLFRSMDEYKEYNVPLLAIYGYYLILCGVRFSLIPLKSFQGYSISSDSGEYHKRVMVIQKRQRTFVSLNYFYLKALLEKNLSYQTISPAGYYKKIGLQKKAVLINFILLVMVIACFFIVQNTEELYSGIFIGLILLLALATKCDTGFLLENEYGQLKIHQGRLFFKKVEKVIKSIYISQNNVFLISKVDEIYLVQADGEIIQNLQAIR